MTRTESCGLESALDVAGAGPGSWPARGVWRLAAEGGYNPFEQLDDLLTEEALLSSNRQALADWIAAQPPWSDFPFILLRLRGAEPIAQLERSRNFLIQMPPPVDTDNLYVDDSLDELPRDNLAAPKPEGDDAAQGSAEDAADAQAPTDAAGENN